MSTGNVWTAIHETHGTVAVIHDHNLVNAIHTQQEHAARSKILPCGAVSVSDNDIENGWQCTRPANHPGRHIATTRTGIAAAWPGNQPPTLTDLKATP
jgi:hypothetical protein